MVASLDAWAALAKEKETLTKERDELRKERDELRAANAALTKECDALKSGSGSAAPGAGVPAAAAAATAPAATAALAAPGATVVELPEAGFLAPRGRFKPRVCANALVLQGKSAEIVVPYASVGRVWELPEMTGQGTVLVLGLVPPAANGKAMLHFVTLHSKPSDPELSIALGGEPAKGRAAALLRRALEPRLLGGVTVSALGAFKPQRGVGGLQCYNKASEAAAYLLDGELLLKEGGRITVLPYGRLRAEVLPPSGRRTFDVQLECAPSAAGLAAAAASGAVAKPVRLELSMIAADECAGVMEALKRRKVNVNGCRDHVGAGAEGGAAEGDEGAPAVGEEGEEGSSSEGSGEEDESDDEEDDDYAASDKSDCEEEYDSEDGEEIEGAADGPESADESESESADDGADGGEESDGADAAAAMEAKKAPKAKAKPKAKAEAAPKPKAKAAPKAKAEASAKAKAEAKAEAKVEAALAAVKTEAAPSASPAARAPSASPVARAPKQPPADAADGPPSKKAKAEAPVHPFFGAGKPAAKAEAKAEGGAENALAQNAPKPAAAAGDDDDELEEMRLLQERARAASAAEPEGGMVAPSD